MKILKIEPIWADPRMPHFGEKGTEPYQITYKLWGNKHHYAQVYAVDEMQAYKLAMPAMLKNKLSEITRRYGKYTHDNPIHSVRKASKKLLQLHKEMEEVKAELKKWKGI